MGYGFLELDFLFMIAQSAGSLNRSHGEVELILNVAF